MGITYDVHGKGQRGIGIHTNHFEKHDTFQFVADGPVEHFEIIIGLGFVGLTPEMSRAVSFEPISQYVVDVITEFEKVATVP
jgi:hypothetical protein